MRDKFRNDILEAQRIANEKDEKVIVEFRNSKTIIHPGLSPFTKADLNVMLREALFPDDWQEGSDSFGEISKSFMVYL